MSKFRKQHMAIDWYDIIDTDSTSPIKDAPLSEKAALVGRLGMMMLSVGTAAWRVRASMNKLSRALGIVCSADIGLMSIEYTCISGGETSTGAFTLSTTGINTDKLNALEDFADGFQERAGKYSSEQFHRILDKIQSMPANYKPISLALASAIACAAFTYLLGGGTVEMLCAFLGAGVGQFVRKLLIDRHITLLANVVAGVAAACCTYIGGLRLAEMLFGIPQIHRAGYICAMLFIIPGFPLITGGLDLAKLDLRSGIERCTYAIMIIVTATLTGWVAALALGFSPSEFDEPEMNAVIRCLLRMIASFCGVYGFSFLYNSPQKMAVTAGLIGMIANTLRLELIELTGIPMGIAAFIGALCAGLLASAIKKFVGYPRITLTVPSIVIMVPGMFMYKGVYFIGLGDTATGTSWLVKAVLLVLALPLGLIFARIFTDNNFRRSS